MNTANLQSDQFAYAKAAETVDDFCASLSISGSVFYEQVKKGRIRVLKLGRRTLVPTTERTAFLDSLRSSKAA